MCISITLDFTEMPLKIRLAYCRHSEDWICRFWMVISNYNTKDKDHGRPIKVFEDKKFEMLRDEDPCQTQTELIATLNVT